MITALHEKMIALGARLPVEHPVGHVEAVGLGDIAAIAGFDGADHIDPLIHLAPLPEGSRAATEGFFAKHLHRLGDGHVEFPIKGIHLVALILGDHVFAGGERVEADHILVILTNQHGRCAEDGQFLVEGRQRPVEVGAAEDGTHLPLHLLQPDFYRRMSGQLRVVGSKPEPRPGWRSQPGHHARNQRAHGLGRRMVEDFLVAFAALVIVDPHKLPTGRLDDVGHLLPVLHMGGPFIAQRLQASLIGFTVHGYCPSRVFLL